MHADLHVPMPPAPQGILFDLDGTLLDTAADLHRALNVVLKAHRKPLVSLADARPVASHGSTGLLQLGFGEDFNADNRLSLRQAFLDAYATDPISQTRYFDGVEATLQRLQAQGIAFGIVTNKPTKFTQALMPHFDLLNSCPAIVCGDTLAVAKPDPAPLLHAAQQLGVEAQHIWYVGDAQRDIEAGQRANMRTVLAAYGYISADEDPQAWGADMQISQPQGLLELWKHNSR
jgi:N-acetyl-D-muramate 6-phosphate phosphatase